MNIDRAARGDTSHKSSLKPEPPTLFQLNKYVLIVNI